MSHERPLPQRDDPPSLRSFVRIVSLSLFFGTARLDHLFFSRRGNKFLQKCGAQQTGTSDSRPLNQASPKSDMGLPSFPLQFLQTSAISCSSFQYSCFSNNTQGFPTSKTTFIPSPAFSLSTSPLVVSVVSLFLFCYFFYSNFLRHIQASVYFLPLLYIPWHTSCLSTPFLSPRPPFSSLSSLLTVQAAVASRKRRQSHRSSRL